jgi:hypothetical protein
MFNILVSETNHSLLNVDGDFSQVDDSPYWWVWCSDGVEYSYSFTDKGILQAEIWGGGDPERKYQLATVKQYIGHGLPSAIMLKGKQINLEFDASILDINITHREEFLRLTMVVCVHLDGGKRHLYTEYDFYQSPNCRRNIFEGGNFRYYVIGEQTIEDGWVHYEIDFTKTFINKWGGPTYDAGNLQAIIFTIELKNANATLCFDNIKLLGGDIPVVS